MVNRKNDLVISSKKLILSLIAIFVIGSLASVSSLSHNTPQDENIDSSPPVLFITIESVRADHVGPCYGYRRNTSPNICEIAEDGVLFKNTFAQGSRTVVSMPSLLTGRNPAEVGMFNHSERLPSNLATVDRELRKEGYETNAYGSLARFYGKSDPIMSDTWRLWQEKNKLSVIKPAEGRFSIWFPFGPHTPYIPDKKTSKFRNISNSELSSFEEEVWQAEKPASWFWNNAFSKLGKNETVALYDEEIYQTDLKIGEIKERMERKEIYEDTLIIITSDHGERFEKPRNMPHGGPPEKRVTHVPLIIKFPENEYSGTTVKKPVRHIDVVPTIYDVVGKTKPSEVEGESLLNTLEKGFSRERLIYAAQSPDLLYHIYSDNKTIQIDRPNSLCYKNSLSANSPVFTVKAGFSNFLNRLGFDYTEKYLKKKLCRLYREGRERRASFKYNEADQKVRDRLKNMGYLK